MDLKLPQFLWYVGITECCLRYFVTGRWHDGRALDTSQCNHNSPPQF